MQDKLKSLVEQPWTWVGPNEVTEGGETHFELTVAELPDFFVAAPSPEKVLEEARPALESFLLSYVEADEEPPEPAQNNTWSMTVMFMRAATSGKTVVLPPMEPYGAVTA